MKLLKDCFYLWGQTPMSHHAGNNYKLPGINRMDTAEGCDFFGIDRTFRVAMATGPCAAIRYGKPKIKTSERSGLGCNRFGKCIAQ